MRTFNDQCIFHENLEHFEGRDLTDRRALEKKLMDLPSDGVTYVLLDEVQYIEGWEKTVAALEGAKHFDVYITSSTSTSLSDLSTHLSGRYMEIRTLPLSFAEYLELHPGDRDVRFSQYLAYGGLPDANPDVSDRFCWGYLEGVF